MNLFSVTRKKNAGFTLIELLIVMVIIAVLATLGFVSYQNAIANARKSKAISDMKAWQAAMEQGYTANGGSYLTGGNCADASMELTLVAPTGMSYSSGSCQADSYCRCATLATSGSVAGANSTDASCSFANSGSNLRFFCVQNRQ